MRGSCKIEKYARNFAKLVLLFLSFFLVFHHGIQYNLISTAVAATRIGNVKFFDNRMRKPNSRQTAYPGRYLARAIFKGFDMNDTIKVYKGFNPDWTCRDFKFNVGENGIKEDVFYCADNAGNLIEA